MESVEMTSKPKTRRTKTAHEGVKYRLRTRADNGQQFWLARWKDPDTGRRCEASLTALGLTTAEARREWAVRKSEQLRQRSAALAAGATPITHTALHAAIESFLDRCRHELRPSSAARYATNAAKFQRWAEEARIHEVESITPAALARYRGWLAQQSACKATPGGRRGAKGPKGRLSPETLNTDLAVARSMLNYWRRLGMLPRCTADGIKDSLNRFLTERPRPPFLRPPEIRSLVEAALRHDSACFAMTREEKIAGLLSGVGTTPRHRPIAPLVNGG